MRTYRDKKFIGSVFVRFRAPWGDESFQNISVSAGKLKR
jgi:hypothetical protein